MKKLILIGIIAFSFVFANAQNSKIEDIKLLMTMTKVDSAMISVVKTMFNDIANLGDNSALNDSMVSIMQIGMTALLDSTINIYDKLFTHDDIKQLVAFYRTPLGQKMLVTVPKLMELSMRAGKNWALANGDLIKEKLGGFKKSVTPYKPTYEELYDPNEVFNPDYKMVVKKPSASKETISGSKNFKYKISYNKNDWNNISSEDINSSADLTFTDNTESCVAMVIAENENLSLQELKAAALFNMHDAAQMVTTESLGIREVNGKNMLCMRLTVIIDNEEYKYYNYYYSGSWGILQFVILCPASDFENKIKIIEELLAGIEVE